jgi:hypothetical protein
MRVSRIDRKTLRINTGWTLEKLLGVCLIISFAFGCALGLLSYDLSHKVIDLQEQLRAAREQRDFWESATKHIAGEREDFEKLVAEMERINRQLRQDIQVIESHRGGIREMPDGD